MTQKQPLTTEIPSKQRLQDLHKELWIVGLVIGLLHLALLTVDWNTDAGFWRADRADQRFGNMTALIDAYQSGRDLTDTLVAQGNIGDYGVHAALYALGGAFAVTLFQTLLAVPAALCVVYIGFCATNSRRIAMTAALLYGLLPQSLAFPHQLLSEALSNPLLIFGTTTFLVAVATPRRVRWWVASGLLFGLAGMVRPALVLLPFVAAALLMAVSWRHVDWASLATFVVAGLVPFILWGGYMMSQTGKFGPGESHQDLGINLSQSTGKVLLMYGVAQPNGDPPTWLPERISLGDYFNYMKKYPKGFANLYLKNTIVLVSDSGVGRLYVDTLGFGAEARLALQDPLTGWRAQLTNHGPIAMIMYGMKVAPGTIVAGLVGGVAFALVNLGVLIAYASLLRRSSPIVRVDAEDLQRWCLAFLLIVPLYVLATSQVVAYAPSRLRSQGEFAWAVLTCIGWTGLYSWWRARRAAART
jgi:hypothetical protein